jgi:hypothetical protein
MSRGFVSPFKYIKVTHFLYLSFSFLRQRRTSAPVTGSSEDFASTAASPPASSSDDVGGGVAVILLKAQFRVTTVILDWVKKIDLRQIRVMAS